MSTTYKMKIDVECIHNISINTGWNGEVKHIIIFKNLNSFQTYAWITTTSGLSFEEGKKYRIEARSTDDPKRITHVKTAGMSEDADAKSEQPDKPDALDVLLGKTNYCYVVDKGLKI